MQYLGNRDQFWCNLVQRCILGFPTWQLTECLKIWKSKMANGGHLENQTRNSAIAEGRREALVSRNPATTKHLTWKPYRVTLFAWFYVKPFWHITGMWLTHTHTHRQTDRQTTAAYTALSIASRGKNLSYCTAHQLYNYHCRQQATVDSKMYGYYHIFQR